MPPNPTTAALEVAAVLHRLSALGSIEAAMFSLERAIKACEKSGDNDAANALTVLLVDMGVASRLIPSTSCRLDADGDCEHHAACSDCHMCGSHYDDCPAWLADQDDAKRSAWEDAQEAKGDMMRDEGHTGGWR